LLLDYDISKDSVRALVYGGFYCNICKHCSYDYTDCR